MVRSVVILGLVSACLGTIPVCGQGIGPIPGSTYYSRPTVSPYVNLAQRNQYGISAYQTLVRPMLEQQASAERQAMLTRSSLATGRNADGARRGDVQRTAARPGRYMNYSHFYGPPVVR
jgi:hypothetical protein